MIRGRRVATREQQELAVRLYGPRRAAYEMRRRGLEPAIAGGVGWTLVQHSKAFSATHTTTALTGATTTGNMLVVAIANVVTLPTSLSDSAGNTWASMGSSSGSVGGSVHFQAAWICANAAGTASHTVSFSGGDTGSWDLWVAEFSGNPATLVQDGTWQSAYTPTPATTISTPVFTPTAAGSILFNVNQSGSSYTNGTTWTLIDTSTNGDGWSFLVANDTAGHAADWTQASSSWASTIFGVKSVVPVTQTLRPNSDVATTGWSTAPLWSKLNDSSDATFVTATLA